MVNTYVAILHVNNVIDLFFQQMCVTLFR